jgi:hypothetical protein
MTSYIKILQKLDAFCTAHLQIKKFIGEFREQMPNFSTMDERYPIVFASPISDVEDLNTNQFTLEIYCVDIIQKDRANLNTIVSDCHLILKDLFIYYRDDNDADLDVVGTASISFVNNFDLDYVAGAVMTITFEVAGYGSCEIPMLPITPTHNDCEPATLIVRDSDDNVLYTLTVDSGATETQVIADSTAELYFDGDLIDSMQILAEGSDAFNIDCATTLNAVRVTSVSLSHAHTGTFVYVGDVNGKPSYEKSDDPDRIIYYDGTRWILEKLGGGAHTHEAAIGNEAFPWLADWSLEDISMVQATIGTYCQNGGDALNILVNGNIEGDVNNAYPVEIELTDGVNPVTPDAVTIIGNTVTIEAPDATVTNSDTSYTQTISSGATFTLPDETINIVDELNNPLGSVTFPVYTDPNIDITSYCLPATVENSNATYSDTVISGGTLVLPDTTFDIYVNGVFNQSVTLPTLDNANVLNINN